MRIFLYFLIFFNLKLLSIELLANNQRMSDNIVLSKSVLDNGLEVYISTNNRASVCAYSITYKVGSFCEQKNQTGISHMLEHLMFKQLEAYKEGDIDKIISSIGGIGFNANTGRDFTNYIVEVPCKYLSKVLEIDRDRLTKLKISQDSLDLEKKVVLSERRMRVDNSVFGKMFLATYKSIMAQTPYAHPIIGVVKDIKNYKKDTILDYYHKHYTPNNAIVVIVAGTALSNSINKKTILDKVKNTLGKVPRGPKTTCNGDVIFKKSKKIQFVKTDTKTDRLILSYKVDIKKKEDIFFLKILDRILSNGSSSLTQRFFQNKAVGYAGSYVDYLKEVSVLNLYALSFSKKYKWQNILNNLEEMQKYLFNNLEKELKRVYKMQKLEFYESLEDNEGTRDFIKESILLYGDLKTAENLYKQSFQKNLKELKILINKVFNSSLKNIVISRGVK